MRLTSARPSLSDPLVDELRIPVDASDHIFGDAAAPLTLLEYGGYQCPYCGAAHPMIQRLLLQFGAELRFVFRHFPLAHVHPQAVAAAATAEVAAAHDRFWPVHRALMEHWSDLGPGYYDALFAANGLPVADLQDAAKIEAGKRRIQDQHQGGVANGVAVTPTFFINGQRYEGRVEFDHLRMALDAAKRMRPKWARWLDV